MEAIDVSESEGEQDVVVSIDGDDESESSGSEEGDDVLLSISVRDDSDNEDQENSSIESPISTYDPIPAASLLSSSTPSPSMMAGRLGVSTLQLSVLYMQSVWSFLLFFITDSLILFFHAHENRNSYLAECSSRHITKTTRGDRKKLGDKVDRIYCRIHYIHTTIGETPP